MLSSVVSVQRLPFSSGLKELLVICDNPWSFSKEEPATCSASHTCVALSSWSCPCLLYRVIFLNISLFFQDRFEFQYCLPIYLRVQWALSILASAESAAPLLHCGTSRMRWCLLNEVQVVLPLYLCPGNSSAGQHSWAVWQFRNVFWSQWASNPLWQVLAAADRWINPG